MKMKHVLLEMYCGCKTIRPSYCKGIGHVCVHNNCKHLGCTYCPNEIAFASSNGVIESVDDFIGFGGAMEPEGISSEEKNMLLKKWETICKKKIGEAYDEYMKLVD